MTTMISYTSDPATVEVRLSDAPVEYEFSSEVIADVNRRGNWIHGLELLGSGIQFSLEHALAALIRKSSSASAAIRQREPTIKYDEDANAGYLYLPYASQTSVEQDSQSNPLLLKSSYTVGDDKATFGLAADKTLVFTRFTVPAGQDAKKFVQLFRNQP